MFGVALAAVPCRAGEVEVLPSAGVGVGPQFSELGVHGQVQVFAGGDVAFSERHLLLQARVAGVFGPPGPRLEPSLAVGLTFDDLGPWGSSVVFGGGPTLMSGAPPHVMLRLTGTLFRVLGLEFALRDVGAGTGGSITVLLDVGAATYGFLDMLLHLSRG